ncbi:mitochondrial carrier [Ascoidea rubescens DSM 1968]|uniref:Mitochondrial carrier n=1 Tax=Ascoidea rubescens DSM 1968 TaxID=1344418 RepID=A0A1D2VDQ8_9ASCO|nr:mitochondrial carrier [Ascoidea rubescens DSM 1968]ODV59722.1 mitochondrial carrier [Ascoidea rubescens DSM 1968]
MSENRANAKKESQGGYIGFVAGMFSGVAKNLVGHPFDTIKVRLQTSENRFKGPLDCVYKTARLEGIRGFYKGCTPPLIGWVVMDAVMLGSLTNYRQCLMETVYSGQEELPLVGHCLAGVGAGWTVSFVAAPIEQIKARLQVQYDPKSRLYSGPINCLSKIVGSSGIRGLYSGLFSTMVFRTNFLFWWGSYEIFTTQLRQHTHLSDVAVNFWSGGLSATVFWVFAYPADVVKQVVMTDSPTSPRHATWAAAVAHVYRTRGWRGFFRGFVPSILRSFPANAAALAAFEFVNTALR